MDNLYLEQEVGWFSDVKKVQSSPRKLRLILDDIKNGKYMATIDYLRTLPEKEYKDRRKDLLPMFTVSGHFTHRSLSGLSSYTCFLGLDFDKFPTNTDALSFRDKLIGYAHRLHLIAVWMSPSNLGVKAIMVHDNQDPAEHVRLFHQVKRDLFPKTPQFDMTCRDYSRGCFMSSDPWLYINPDTIPYHFVPDPSVIIPKPKKQGQYTPGQTQTPYQHTSDELFLHRMFCEKEKSVLGLTRDADKSLIDYLDKKWRVQFPDSYQDGHKHQSILARGKSLCLAGVLVDNALEYFMSTFGKYGISESDIRNMTNYTYNTNSDDWGKDRAYILGQRLQGRQKRIDKIRGN